MYLESSLYRDKSTTKSLLRKEKNKRNHENRRLKHFKYSMYMKQSNDNPRKLISAIHENRKQVTKL